MIRRGSLFGVIASVLASCGEGHIDRHDRPFGEPVETAGGEAAELLLPALPPPPKGEPVVSMLAIVGGTLRIEPPCVFIKGEGAGDRVIVWPAGTRLRNDASGPFVEASDGPLRDGDLIEGGGGEVEVSRVLVAELAVKIPSPCYTERAAVLSSIRQIKPGSAVVRPAPEPSPPPS